MRIPGGRKLIVGAVVALGVAAAGGAFAASRLDSPSARSQAIIDDAAGQLAIQPSALSKALKKAIEDQIDAAAKAGEITQAQADAMKARIESGDFPIFGGGPGFGFGHHGFGVGLFDFLGTAADYLGMPQADLRSELESGKTLAQVAREKGKPVDGLISALVDAAKKRIEQAVDRKTGQPLTKDQIAKIEAGLEQRMTDLVNGTHSGKGFGFRQGGFDGPGPGGSMRGWMGPQWRGGAPDAAGTLSF